jgi:methylenetetrahydrofolate reductase (NADPH)
MERKAAAGADFFIPQLGYDMRKFFEIKRYLASRKINVPVIGNVYALTAGAAQAMKEGGVPGCVVTDELVNLLKAEAAEPDKGKGKRLERAAKMVAMFKGMGFNGVHIGGFGLKSQDFVYIIQRGLELAPQWDSFIGEVSFSRPDEFYAFPPPAKYQVSESEADPATRIGLGRPVLAYSFMSAVHSLMFERGSLGCKAMTAYYGVVDKQPLLSRMSHAFEHASKQLIFGCRDCGDCGLPDLAYRCPTSRCAKQQRNGPCGGSRDGMCEVYPTEKECAWSEVYRRLKGCGRIEELRTAYVPPCHRELSYTSGWANFYLNRDHTAIRPKASPEAAATPGKPGTAAPAAAIH